MIRPTVHLNGTSRDVLLEQLTAASAAIGSAIASLFEAAPNARDYYPQGDGAFAVARREHETRVAKLKETQAELMALIEHVDES